MTDMLRRLSNSNTWYHHYIITISSSHICQFCICYEPRFVNWSMSLPLQDKKLEWITERVKTVLDKNYHYLRRENEVKWFGCFRHLKAFEPLSKMASKSRISGSSQLGPVLRWCLGYHSQRSGDGNVILQFLLCGHGCDKKIYRKITSYIILRDVIT